MKRESKKLITVEKLMEVFCIPIEQQIYLAFSESCIQSDWKCLEKNKNKGGWLFKSQISCDTKPVCVLHGANLAQGQLLLDIKKIVYLMSCNPNQKEVYIKEEWTTNYQDVEMLLAMYHPEKRGIITAGEKLLIQQALHLERRDILDLRNLRDNVVLLLENKFKKDVVWENMDKMSAVTTVIDQKIWELGGKV